MSLKKIGLALIAVLALSAIVVSSSAAAVSTTRAEWYTGASPGTTLPVGTSKNVKEAVEVVSHGEIGAKAEFTTAIGTTPIVLTSTKIKCIECEIENKESTSVTAGPAAFGEGRILFENVTVDLPAS